jgi:hypothetical protein
VIVSYTAVTTSYNLMVRDLRCIGAPDTGSRDYCRSVASGAWVLVAQHCKNRPSMLHVSSS